MENDKVMNKGRKGVDLRVQSSHRNKRAGVVIIVTDLRVGGGGEGAVGVVVVVGWGEG